MWKKLSYYDHGILAIISPDDVRPTTPRIPLMLKSSAPCIFISFFPYLVGGPHTQSICFPSQLL